jgi:hypothetical protein
LLLDPYFNNAPQPPGPGLPLQAPSVKMMTLVKPKTHTLWGFELSGENVIS